MINKDFYSYSVDLDLFAKLSQQLVLILGQAVVHAQAYSHLQCYKILIIHKDL